MKRTVADCCSLWVFSIALSLTLTSFFILVSCGSRNGSSIGKFYKEANFPLYYTTTGSAPGFGAIYKVDLLARGDAVEGELLVSGLNFPSGVAIATTGVIYVAEKMPAPHGSVKMIEPGSTEATVLISGLDNPEAVAVDTFNRVYVTEGDKNRISKILPSGELEIFAEGNLSGPRHLFVDLQDQVYVAETGSGVVSRYDQLGIRTVLVSGLTNPFGLTADLANELYVVINNTGSSDGAISHIDGSLLKTLVTDLINPIAIAFDNAHGFFIIEGSPANRIVAYNIKSGEKTIVVETLPNPYSLVMSPY